MKVDNQQNMKKILVKFTEKWTDAEKMIRGQTSVEEIPSSMKAPVQVPNPKHTITLQGSGYNREDLQERVIILNERRKVCRLVKSLLIVQIVS